MLVRLIADASIRSGASQAVQASRKRSKWLDTGRENEFTKRILNNVSQLPGGLIQPITNR